MNKLKVGIAGYGIVGKRRHFFIKEHPQLEVIGICDQSFKEHYTLNEGISYYQNTNELLKLNLDILFICLVNNVAAEVTIEEIKITDAPAKSGMSTFGKINKKDKEEAEKVALKV